LAAFFAAFFLAGTAFFAFTIAFFYRRCFNTRNHHFCGFFNSLFKFFIAQARLKRT